MEATPRTPTVTENSHNTKDSETKFQSKRPANDSGCSTEKSCSTSNISDSSAAEKLPPAEPQEVERKLTGLRWAVFMISTLTSVFIYSLDNTIVADIVPAIVNSLGNENLLPWLSVGFMVGGLASILPYGQLYSLYDARWIFIYSFIVFNIGSAVCGAAPSMTAEIIGRTIGGWSGNGMYVGMLTLISTNTTSKERPFWLTLTGSVWGLGTVLGPVIGGGFELVSWRWGFYINLIIGAVLFPIYLLVIPSSNPKDVGTMRIKKMDHIGIVLSVAAFVTLIMGMNFGGTVYNWNSGQIISLFAVSGVLWLAFGTQQSLPLFTTLEKRIFPVQLLSNLEVMLLFISTAAAGGACYVTVYYIPIYFQFTRGDSAIMAAVRLLPLIFPLIAAIPVSGWMLSRIGYYKPFYLGGSVVALVGSVLMSRVTKSSSLGAIYAFEILIGLGAGVYSQSAFAAVQSVVGPLNAASGLTLMIVAQLSGISLGLAIAGAIFVNITQTGLRELLPDVPMDKISQLISGTSGVLYESLSAEIQERALEIIVSAWQKLFIGVYAGVAASVVAAVFMKNQKINVVAVAGGH